MVPQISGRVANAIDDTTVQEVPTDGTMALFPSADGSCIYSKRWTPDGNILTMRFVPEASDAQPKQPSRLDIIDNRIAEQPQHTRDDRRHQKRRCEPRA